jgi:hypothetical protein
VDGQAKNSEQHAATCQHQIQKVAWFHTMRY